MKPTLSVFSPKLIVISAPSGAGKTTICERLLKDFSHLILSISSTTRAPRGKEQNGREYFFMSQDEFKNKISQNQFAEWAQVHGHYYGTSKEVLEKAFAQGLSVLLDIDVQGASQLRTTYPQQCFDLFITPPNLEELERRLRNRKTDSEETIQKRLKNASLEMSRRHEFRHIIINDRLDRAYQEIYSLVLAQIGISTNV